MNAEDHERLAAQLHEASAISAAVIDAALDAVVIADDLGVIRQFNRAAEAMFGHKASDVIGRRISETIIPPLYRAAHEAGMARHRATGESRVLGRRIEVEGLHADGTVFPAELAIQRVELASGTVFAAYLRDLTAARQAARDIEEAREKMHQNEKLSAMGSLLAGVAHELNNPLAIVVAQASLLEEFAAEADIRARAEKIHAAADRCARIVKSFLAMARQKSPEREAVDVSALLSGVTEMLSYGLRSTGVIVETEVAPDLPPVMAEKDMIGQVVANLILNAQQALSGRPAPRWIGLSAGVVGESLVIRVADNGPGIPEAIAPRIYDPYFTTKPAGAGTGIGLAICRKVVEAHGGEIRHDPREGGGTLFSITLPLGGGAAAAAPVARRGSGPSLRVLIVDDDPDVAASLSDFLKALGHKTSYAASGEAALAAIAGTAYDAVFADLHMPGMDGLALRAALATRDPSLAARTVIVTGDTVAGPAAIAAGPGPEALWIEKPFLRQDIVNVLGRIAPSGN